VSTAPQPAVTITEVKDDRLGRIEARLGELERDRDDTKRRDELRVLLKMALEDALAPVFRWQDAADERYAREQLAKSRDPAPIVPQAAVTPIASARVEPRAPIAPVPPIEPRFVDRSPSISLDDIPSSLDGARRRRSAAIWATAIILVVVSNLAIAMFMSRSH